MSNLYIFIFNTSFGNCFKNLLYNIGDSPMISKRRRLIVARGFNLKKDPHRLCNPDIILSNF